MRRGLAALFLLAVACGPDAEVGDTDGDTELACPPGSEPAGELAWSGAGMAFDVGSFERLAARSGGRFVGVGSIRAGDGHDDVGVVAFDLEGTEWSAEYDGLAGLGDTSLDVVVDADGRVVVLIREALTEQTTEFGSAIDARLVTLTYDGDVGGEPERYEWERPAAPPMTEYAPSGAIGIVDGETIIVGWIDSESPSFLRVAADGTGLGETLLEQPADSRVKEARVGPTGRVFLSGSTTVAGDDAGWIGTYESDGALAWSLVLDGENIEYVVVAPHVDGGAFAYWGSELGTGTGGATFGRIDAAGAIAWSHVVDTPGVDGYSGRVAAPCWGGLVLAVASAAGDVVVSRLDDDGNEINRSTHAGASTMHDVIASGDIVVSAASAPGAPWLARIRAGE